MTYSKLDFIIYKAEQASLERFLVFEPTFSGQDLKVVELLCSEAIIDYVCT